MKSFFSRKHNTQTGHSKSTSKDSATFPSDSERNTAKPALNTADAHSAARNFADLRTSSHNPKSTNGKAARDKLTPPIPPKASSTTERIIYPTTRTNTTQQENHHPIPSQPPPKATSKSREQRDSEHVKYYPPPRAFTSPNFMTPSHLPALDRIKNESVTVTSHERQIPPLLPTNGEEQGRYDYVERYRARHEEKEMLNESVRKETEVARDRNRREGERDRIRSTKDRDREVHVAVQSGVEHDKNVQRHDKERMLEREQTGERDGKKDHERTKVKEWEREREQERAQKARERERPSQREKGYENERERGQGKEKREKERLRERERKEYREKYLEGERRDRESYEHQRYRHERDQREKGQQAVTLVDNVSNLKREQETSRKSEQKKKLQYDRTAFPTKVYGTASDERYRDDKVTTDRYQQKERHHELMRLRAEVTDGEQGLVHTKKTIDHDRRKEGKSGWVSDNNAGQEHRVTQQPRFEPPVDTGNASDDSINRMNTQKNLKSERTEERNPQAHSIVCNSLSLVNLLTTFLDIAIPSRPYISTQIIY